MTSSVEFRLLRINFYGKWDTQKTASMKFIIELVNVARERETVPAKCAPLKDVMHTS